MATKAGEKPFQLTAPEAVIIELQRAALDLKAAIRRERSLNAGPMAGYVLRWFLSLESRERLRIVQAGKRIADGERPLGDEPTSHAEPEPGRLVVTLVPIMEADEPEPELVPAKATRGRKAK